MTIATLTHNYTMVDGTNYLPWYFHTDNGNIMVYLEMLRPTVTLGPIAFLGNISRITRNLSAM